MTDSESDETASRATASEDAKAKFREALDRKKAAHHPSAEGGESKGPVSSSDPVTASQRTFRRKSG